MPLYTSHALARIRAIPAEPAGDCDWVDVQCADPKAGVALRHPTNSSGACTNSRELADSLDGHADQHAHAHTQCVPGASGAVGHLAAGPSFAASPPSPHTVATFEASAASAAKEVSACACVCVCVCVCVCACACA